MYPDPLPLPLPTPCAIPPLLPARPPAPSTHALQAVHGAYRVPALARGLVKIVSKDGDEVADEVEEAAARPQTRSGREVAWSQSEVKTAQLVQAIKETRYVGCVAAAACCASAVLVVPPFYQSGHSRTLSFNASS